MAGHLENELKFIKDVVALASKDRQSGKNWEDRQHMTVLTTQYYTDQLKLEPDNKECLSQKLHGHALSQSDFLLWNSFSLSFDGQWSPLNL